MCQLENPAAYAISDLFVFKNPDLQNSLEAGFQKSVDICLHSLSTGLFLSLAIMVIWGHLLCCQGFFNTNFNDLLEVNKLRFPVFRVCTQAWRSLPLSSFPGAASFLESRATVAMRAPSLLGVQCSLEIFLLWAMLTAPQSRSVWQGVRTERERQSSWSRKSMKKKQTTVLGWLVLPSGFGSIQELALVSFFPHHPIPTGSGFTLLNVSLALQCGLILPE